MHRSSRTAFVLAVAARLPAWRRPPPRSRRRPADREDACGRPQGRRRQPVLPVDRQGSRGRQREVLDRRVPPHQLPQEGPPAPPLAAPDTTHPATNVLDAAGAPFWFNGQGTPVIPAIVGFGSGSGNPTPAPTSSVRLSAGNGPPKPFVVKFPRPAATPTTASCTRDEGQGHVVAKSKPVPSAKADAERVAPQLAEGLATLKQLTSRRLRPTPWSPAPTSPARSCTASRPRR